MLAPVLEIYVVWHPLEAADAEAIALDLAEHFQGGAFASLLSGAVEVYVRCAGWANKDDAPRPIAWLGGAPSIGGTIAAATGRSALRQAGQSKQAGRGCASRSQALAVVTTSINSTQAQARRRSSVRRESAVVTMSAFEGRRASS